MAVIFNADIISFLLIIDFIKIIIINIILGNTILIADKSVCVCVYERQNYRKSSLFFFFYLST